MLPSNNSTSFNKYDLLVILSRFINRVDQLIRRASLGFFSPSIIKISKIDPSNYFIILPPYCCYFQLFIQDGSYNWRSFIYGTMNLHRPLVRQIRPILVFIHPLQRSKVEYNYMNTSNLNWVRLLFRTNSIYSHRC